jgi:hypothetical protein
VAIRSRTSATFSAMDMQNSKPRRKAEAKCGTSDAIERCRRSEGARAYIT